MKLEGIHGKTVYASQYRSILTETDGPDFARTGQLPSVEVRTASLIRFLQTNSITKRLLSKLVGRYLTSNIWLIANDEIYATRGNDLFRSSDGGGTWTRILRLPPSSGPMGILPSGLCVHEDTIYVGEYPLDRERPPRLLASSNNGNDWRIATTFESRHIHAVQTDPFTGDLWITTGDTDKESMIVRIVDGNLEIIGTGSQLWRAVELVFTPSAILWGMDCPYADENCIVKIDRDDLDSAEPSVETLRTVSSPVYYAKTIEIDGEHHVFFSTAIEPATEPRHEARVLHASSVDNYETWQTVASYEAGSAPLSRLVPTNSYIFLAAHPERGLFVNPYNTRTDHGTIRNIPITRFRRYED